MERELSNLAYICSGKFVVALFEVGQLAKVLNVEIPDDLRVYNAELFLKLLEIRVEIVNTGHQLALDFGLF